MLIYWVHKYTEIEIKKNGMVAPENKRIEKDKSKPILQ